MNKTNPQKDEELISVILPAYGVEKYIARCLNSVINQTYQNLEIIVVDDGTKDDSGIIAEKYAEKDNRIYVYHKDNGGLSEARNYGIQKAHGKYLTCIDSDDYVDDTYVEYLYSLIRKAKVKMSVCQHRVVNDAGYVIYDYGKTGWEVLDDKSCIKRMLYHDVIDTSAWAKLYDSTLFSSIQYPVGKNYEDIATTYRLMVASKQISVGYEAKYNYVYRNNSIVTSSFSQKKFDLIEMTDQMANDVKLMYSDLDKAILRRRVYSRFSTLNQMLNVNGYQKQKDDIVTFIKHNGFNVFRDPIAPKRDKLAILVLSLGLPVYRFIWKLYLKFTKLK